LLFKVSAEAATEGKRSLSKKLQLAQTIIEELVEFGFKIELVWPIVCMGKAIRSWVA